MKKQQKIEAIATITNAADLIHKLRHRDTVVTLVEYDDTRSKLSDFIQLLVRETYGNGEEE